MSGRHNRGYQGITLLMAMTEQSAMFGSKVMCNIASAAPSAAPTYNPIRPLAESVTWSFLLCPPVDICTLKNPPLGWLIGEAVCVQLVVTSLLPPYHLLHPYWSSPANSPYITVVTQDGRIWKQRGKVTHALTGGYRNTATAILLAKW